MAVVEWEIVTSSSNKAPVWRHFGYVKDSATEKATVGKKVTCRLCQMEVMHSGRTTNLKNHFCSHHLPEYRDRYSDEHGGTSATQGQLDVFCKASRSVKKLFSSSPRAQELTGAVVDFLMRDLRPVNVVDSVGFLHLLNVAEPQYIVPCHHTIDSYIDRRYLAEKTHVKQELKQIEYVGLTTDMWTSRSKDRYISLTAYSISPVCDAAL